MIVSRFDDDDYYDDHEYNDDDDGEHLEVSSDLLIHISDCFF